ncbi:MAG: lysostaphin resistance A-like protein [Clostridiaceae bacterium]
MKKLLKEYILWTYGMFYCFLLVIGVTMVVLKAETLAEILKIVSAWTSTFVFIAMFHKIYPKDSLINFIKRQFSERVKISTVVFIILLQFFVFIVSLLFTGATQNVSLKDQVTTSWITLILLFGKNLISGSIGEELGWRGFVLNQLQKKYSPLKSAIIVGVIWGFWHTPLWLLSGYSGLDLVQYIISFMVAIIAISIIITTFYNLNNNLFIPIIIHQLFNYFLTIQTGNLLHNITISALVYFIVAVILVLVNYKNCLYGRSVAKLKVRVQ